MSEDAQEESGAEAPLVDLAELPAWIVREDDALLVINKPGWLVCHPSKNGPLSSLVGAVREHTGLERMHLVARLDRETSGLVLFAKTPKAARRYQMALQQHAVTKSYLAVLEGCLPEAVVVDQPMGRSGESAVYVRSVVKHTRTSKRAVTRFTPLFSGGGHTLCRVEPETGRKHQIRVHAEWLGHRVAGDKIYGPDETLYLEFIEKGWTDRLAAELPLKRQALHCHSLVFRFEDGWETFTAPLPDDLRAFCLDCLGVSTDELDRLTGPPGTAPNTPPTGSAETA